MESCVVCGSSTRSHPVPAGVLCHTCLTEEDEADILDELPVPPVHDLDADTDLACSWCDHEHTPREVNVRGRNFVTAAVEAVPFDQLDAVLVVSCPHCTQATEYLTTERACLDVIEELHLQPVHEVGR